MPRPNRLAGKMLETLEAEDGGLMIRLRGYDTEGRQKTRILGFLGMNKGRDGEEHSACGLCWNGCQSPREVVSLMEREAALSLHIEALHI